MSVAMWVTFALCVGVAAGFAIGRGVSRDTDTFTISSLRDALTGAAFSFRCPDCEAIIFRSEIESHMRGEYACELLRARAEAEVDRG